MKRFKRGTIAIIRKKLYKCICCDKETAVFAPTAKKRDGGYKTVFRNMIAVSNIKDFDDLKFEIIN